MNNNKLRVVLDTNVLLVSVSSKSKYHWIFQRLLELRYEHLIVDICALRLFI